MRIGAVVMGTSSLKSKLLLLVMVLSTKKWHARKTPVLTRTRKGVEFGMQKFGASDHHPTPPSTLESVAIWTLFSERHQKSRPLSAFLFEHSFYLCFDRLPIYISSRPAEEGIKDEISAMTLCFVPSGPLGLARTSPNHISTQSFQATRAGFFLSRRRNVRAPTHSSITRMAVTEPPTERTPKELAKLYGGSYLGTSIGLSVISFAVFYFLINAGVDIRALLNSLGDWLSRTPLGRPPGIDNISDEAGAAALAYIAHKATSPLRFPVTIAATPLVAKVFARKVDSDDTA